MTDPHNHWCEALGIEVPRLETVVGHREANTFSCFLVALLEHGSALSLEDVAARFETAGIADRDTALRSLQRCRPARAPVYRVGDEYHLDPHDQELDLWVFRLGLRPPRGLGSQAPPVTTRPVPEPVHDHDVPLNDEELDEAWKGAILEQWSSRRLAVAVLDAAREPLEVDRIESEIARRTTHFGRINPTALCRGSSPLCWLDDGRLALGDDADADVYMARRAVRERIAKERAYRAERPEPAEMEASRRAYEERRAAEADELARQKHALLTAFPADAPRAVVLLDVQDRTLLTFEPANFGQLRDRLATYDVLAALDVRALLRALDFDQGHRRLAELGPPQKTITLNRRGRTLRLTTEMVISSSCEISKPLGQSKTLAAYLRDDHLGKLTRRLQADAKSLYALYQFSRLHGAVRLRWGFLDEMLSAPWVLREEPGLHHLMQRAHEDGCALEVVVHRAPGWEEPWARAVLARVVPGEHYGYHLVGEDGYEIVRMEVQAARLSAPRRAAAAEGR